MSLKLQEPWKVLIVCYQSTQDNLKQQLHFITKNVQIGGGENLRKDSDLEMWTGCFFKSESTKNGHSRENTLWWNHPIFLVSKSSLLNWGYRAQFCGQWLVKFSSVELCSFSIRMTSMQKEIVFQVCWIHYITKQFPVTVILAQFIKNNQPVAMSKTPDFKKERALQKSLSMPCHHPKSDEQVCVTTWVVLIISTKISLSEPDYNHFVSNTGSGFKISKHFCGSLLCLHCILLSSSFHCGDRELSNYFSVQ